PPSATTLCSFAAIPFCGRSPRQPSEETCHASAVHGEIHADSQRLSWATGRMAGGTHGREGLRRMPTDVARRAARNDSYLSVVGVVNPTVGLPDGNHSG